MDTLFQYEFEVRDNETDLQGIVNNANYFNYYAHCRHKYLDALGVNFIEMAKKGFNMVLAHADITFKVPLLPGDQFIVTCQGELKGKMRVVFRQTIIRKSDNRIINTAINTGAIVDVKKGCVVPISSVIPENLIKLLTVTK